MTAPSSWVSTRVACRVVRVTVLDYGVGNLHSLTKALMTTGATVRVEADPDAALDTDLLVLPGVGAFSAAAERLAPARAILRTALSGGVSGLGICLGMQLLFEGSDEGSGAGLGVVRGRATRLRAPRVPHMGWNVVDDRLEVASTAPVTDAALQRSALTEAYYAHSYVCRPSDTRVVGAWLTIEGDRFPTIIRWQATVGVQFHPEKSGPGGLRFLREIVAAAGRRTPVASRPRVKRPERQP
jgi:imidazole glycerol-phosphate synthase subunit HisH